MSDQPESIFLAFLRRIDAKLDGLVDELREVKHRLTTLEITFANQAATEASHYASLALRLDRTEMRLDRIERRLDLVAAGTA
jgi:uncharacterized coiled-coil protein SlyX